MSEYAQNRWQKRRCHEACDGDVGSFCGEEFMDVRTMVQNSCMENLTRAGKRGQTR